MCERAVIQALGVGEMIWGEKQAEQQPRGAASEAAGRGHHLKAAARGTMGNWVWPWEIGSDEDGEALLPPMCAFRFLPILPRKGEKRRMSGEPMCKKLVFAANASSCLKSYNRILILAQNARFAW
jgi:hypothetical protein